MNQRPEIEIISPSAFLGRFAEWARHQDAVDSAVLVGTHARGTARPESDVDLVILVIDLQFYLAGSWVSAFGAVNHTQREDYGAVQSLRVFYSYGLEVEFGLTSLDWANVDPLDDGTRDVMLAGARILVDKTGRLSRVLAHLA
jgi:uncharacterized protein